MAIKIALVPAIPRSTVTYSLYAGIIEERFTSISVSPIRAAKISRYR